MKQIAIIFAILLIIPSVSMAIENDGYVLNIKTNGEFVKEVNGTAYLVFDSEYQLLLKNNTDWLCSARVYIDDARVSPGGDFVIYPHDELLLERFVSNLDKGKRFKFVPLNHPEVDDPTRKENGFVRVEFRKVIIDDSNIIYFDDDWWNIELLHGGSLTLTSSSVLDIETNVSNTSNGATISGSESTQKFHKVYYDFEDEYTEVKLILYGIRPGHRQP